MSKILRRTPGFQQEKTLVVSHHKASNRLNCHNTSESAQSSNSGAESKQGKQACLSAMNLNQMGTKNNTFSNKVVEDQKALLSLEQGIDQFQGGTIMVQQASTPNSQCRGFQTFLLGTIDGTLKAQNQQFRAIKPRLTTQCSSQSGQHQQLKTGSPQLKQSAYKLGRQPIKRDKQNSSKTVQQEIGAIHPSNLQITSSNAQRKKFLDFDQNPPQCDDHHLSSAWHYSTNGQSEPITRVKSGCGGGIFSPLVNQARSPNAGLSFLNKKSQSLSGFQSGIQQNCGQQLQPQSQMQFMQVRNGFNTATPLQFNTSTNSRQFTASQNQISQGKAPLISRGSTMTRKVQKNNFNSGQGSEHRRRIDNYLNMLITQHQEQQNLVNLMVQPQQQYVDQASQLQPLVNENNGREVRVNSQESLLLSSILRKGKSAHCLGSQKNAKRRNQVVKLGSNMTLPSQQANISANASRGQVMFTTIQQPHHAQQRDMLCVTEQIDHQINTASEVPLLSQQQPHINLNDQQLLEGEENMKSMSDQDEQQILLSPTTSQASKVTRRGKIQIAVDTVMGHLQVNSAQNSEEQRERQNSTSRVQENFPQTHIASSNAIQYSSGQQLSDQDEIQKQILIQQEQQLQLQKLLPLVDDLSMFQIQALESCVSQLNSGGTTRMQAFSSKQQMKPEARVQTIQFQEPKKNQTRQHIKKALQGLGKQYTIKTDYQKRKFCTKSSGQQQSPTLPGAEQKSPLGRLGPLSIRVDAAVMSSQNQVAKDQNLQTEFVEFDPLAQDTLEHRQVAGFASTTSAHSYDLRSPTKVSCDAKLNNKRDIIIQKAGHLTSSVGGSHSAFEQSALEADTNTINQSKFDQKGREKVNNIMVESITCSKGHQIRRASNHSPSVLVKEFQQIYISQCEHPHDQNNVQMQNLEVGYETLASAKMTEVYKSNDSVDFQYDTSSRDRPISLENINATQGLTSTPVTPMNEQEQSQQLIQPRKMTTMLIREDFGTRDSDQVKNNQNQRQASTIGLPTTSSLAIQREVMNIEGLLESLKQSGGQSLNTQDEISLIKSLVNGPVNPFQTKYQFLPIKVYPMKQGIPQAAVSAMDQPNKKQAAKVNSQFKNHNRKFYNTRMPSPLKTLQAECSDKKKDFKVFKQNNELFVLLDGQLQKTMRNFDRPSQTMQVLIPHQLRQIQPQEPVINEGRAIQEPVPMPQVQKLEFLNNVPGVGLRERSDSHVSKNTMKFIEARTSRGVEEQSVKGMTIVLCSKTDLSDHNTQRINGGFDETQKLSDSQLKMDLKNLTQNQRKEEIRVSIEIEKQQSGLDEEKGPEIESTIKILSQENGYQMKQLQQKPQVQKQKSFGAIMRVKDICQPVLADQIINKQAKFCTPKALSPKVVSSNKFSTPKSCPKYQFAQSDDNVTLENMKLQRIFETPIKINEEL